MIVKAALAVIRGKKILLVKKKGLDEFILPGGKPECGEKIVMALRRELMEELGVAVGPVRFIRRFSDRAAGKKDMLLIHLYKGEISGRLKPQSEISSAKWFGRNSKSKLSPILKNKIVPYFVRKGLV